MKTAHPRNLPDNGNRTLRNPAGAEARGRLGTPGLGGEDPNCRDGSRLGADPSRAGWRAKRSAGQFSRSAGLRPASRGSAKPVPTTLRHANVSAASLSCGRGERADPIMWVSPSGARHSGPQAVHCRPPSRGALILPTSRTPPPPLRYDPDCQQSLGEKDFEKARRKLSHRCPLRLAGGGPGNAARGDAARRCLPNP